MQRVQRIAGDRFPAAVRHNVFPVQREVNILRCDKKRVQKLSHCSPSIALRRYAETDLLLISFGRHNPFSEQALQPFVGFTFGVLPRT